MASGHAEQVEGKIVFGNGERVHYEEQIFLGNPKVSPVANKDTRWMPNFPGCRPYIQGVDPERKRFIFNPHYRAAYGKVYLSDGEREWAAKQVKGDFILVEPYTKDPQGILHLGLNKRWDKWEQLLKLDYPWLQAGQKAPMTRQVPTKSFRRAMALIERAKLVITTDGAIHHAAAALGVPAIVLWGGVVSPKILGYPTHTNIWNGAEPCGTYAHECPHCKQAMRSIALDQVTRHL